jgi:multiple sugar transport system permease protein
MTTCGLVARSPGMMTPPLTLAIFQNADLGFDYQALAAAAATVTAPVVILFLLAQRHFVRGMAGPEVAG